MSTAVCGEQVEHGSTQQCKAAGYTPVHCIVGLSVCGLLALPHDHLLLLAFSPNEPLIVLLRGRTQFASWCHVWLRRLGGNLLCCLHRGGHALNLSGWSYRHAMGGTKKMLVSWRSKHCNLKAQQNSNADVVGKAKAHR